MSRKPLTQEEIQEALHTLSGWSFDSNSLVKQFIFSDFREAIAFVVRLAFEAEAANHHPELTNVYNRVTVALYTHDAGNRVTQRDVALAGAIDRVASGARQRG